MNLFILDNDLTRCAQAHFDSHIGKIQLEATQLLATTIWISQAIGFVPRPLSKEELNAIKEYAKPAKGLSIDSRNDAGFVRYLPSHPNHPCAVWARSSKANFAWIKNYVEALNIECVWRGYKSHAACAESKKLDCPDCITCGNLTSFAQAMPEEYKSSDVIESYRTYYHCEKQHLAKWTKRGAPDWWN